MTIRKMLFHASSVQVLLISFFMGITSAVYMGINQSLLSTEDVFRRSLGVSLFLSSTLTDQEALRLADTLKTQDTEIVSIAYLSKADATQEAQKDEALSKTLLLLKENPLPSSLQITYSDRAWLDRNAPTDALPKTPDIQEIRWDAASRSAFRALNQWRHWLMRLAVLSGGVVVLWSFVGIYRSLAERISFAQLACPVLVGACGGALSILAWRAALHQLGADAMTTPPMSRMAWPLLAGALSGLAYTGSGAKREA
ncbi:MAG: permease-like cell division protein FtsX [Elusimicrobiota bacterium]|jgi:cell division protein FtsX